MQCLILAGGFGTRVQAIAGERPKALLPIAGTPFIDLQLQLLWALGVREVILALGHRSEEIESHLDGHPLQRCFPKLKYCDDGGTPQGTGGAIVRASALLKPNFLVTYGDTLLRLPIHKMMEEHKNGPCPVTLSVYKNKNLADRSNAKLVNDRVVYQKNHPAPDMNYIDYGMMVLTRDHFLSHASKKRPFDLADYLEACSLEGEIQPFEAHYPFLEMGSPSGYRNLCHLFETDQVFLDSLIRDAKR